MALGQVFAWFILSLGIGWIGNGPRKEGDWHTCQKGDARLPVEITAASSSVKSSLGSIDILNLKSD